MVKAMQLLLLSQDKTYLWETKSNTVWEIVIWLPDYHYMIAVILCFYTKEV